MAIEEEQMDEPIDVQAEEVVEGANPGQLVSYEAPSPVLAVTPTVKASELVERLGVIREAMNTAMQKDVDYGVIPGTDKPALYKPGSEKLSVLFQLDVQLENRKTYGPGDHLTVESHATVFHAPTGSRLGYGEGLCTTRERKYAYRKQERVCPTCNAPAVIKGKKEFGGGWLCWKKRDGCGAKFRDGDQSIEGQPVGEVENPDLPDLWNTVVKMAEKRARVDAVLAVTGASALFTQDVEDGPVDAPQEASAQEHPARSDVPSTLPLDGAQYQRLKDAFDAAGRPVDVLNGRMDALDVTASEDIGERIGSLTGQQAEVLISDLSRLAQEQQKETAA